MLPLCVLLRWLDELGYLTSLRAIRCRLSFGLIRLNMNSLPDYHIVQLMKRILFQEGLYPMVKN